MSKATVAYITATLFGALYGWGFAVEIREIFELPPYENAMIWTVGFGVTSPTIVWLFLRDSLRQDKRK